VDPVRLRKIRVTSNAFEEERDCGDVELAGEIDVNLFKRMDIA
jgi:hypothetical protein